MAKRVDRSRFALDEFRPPPIEKYLERLVQPTDTLQGLALQFNTTVAELKKVNNIISETEFHGRRYIKVPNNLLVDLEDAVPLLHGGIPSNNSDSLDLTLELSGDEANESDPSNNGQVYLNKVDVVVKDIKTKEEILAGKSPFVNGSDSPILSREDFSTKGELKWWMALIPCLLILIIFPVLYFLYREEEEERRHHDHEHR